MTFHVFEEPFNVKSANFERLLIFFSICSSGKSLDYVATGQETFPCTAVGVSNLPELSPLRSRFCRLKRSGQVQGFLGTKRVAYLEDSRMEKQAD